MQNGFVVGAPDGLVVYGPRDGRAPGERRRWAKVRVIGTECCLNLQPGRAMTFGRGSSSRTVDVVLADLQTLSRVAVELTLREDALWVHAHQRRGGVVDVLLPGGHLLTSLREGHAIPVCEVVFRVRIRVDRGIFDLHIVQNAIPQTPSLTGAGVSGATASTSNPWRPAALLTTVPGEDWRRVLALACAMTVYPHSPTEHPHTPPAPSNRPEDRPEAGSGSAQVAGQSRPAQDVHTPAHGWDAQVPAFKHVLAVCGRLFGGKPSPKWLSDRLDKALAAFGEPADNRDKLARLVPLVLRIGLIDDATMLALAHQIHDLSLPAHLAHLAHEPTGGKAAEEGDRRR